MNKLSDDRKIYVVVEAIRGVVVAAYSFSSSEKAVDCLDRLRAGRNLDEDDVQLFVTQQDETPRMTGTQ